jgi:transposase
MTTLDADSPLPDDIESAHRLIRELLATLRQQAHLNESLQHQLEQLLRRLYGRKSERLDPGQLLLFAQEVVDAGGPEVKPGPEPGPTPAAARPSARGHGRKPLPAGLPRKRTVHDVPPEERPCPDCGATRQPFGEEVREPLEYVPASLIVLQHVRPKYACEACQAHVVIAERLPEPIEKGLPGPGLMAHVAVSKYADHLLYRQEGIFTRFGVGLSRSTMCDWMAAAAGLLAPVVKAMLTRVLMSEVVQTDDTTVKIQDHDGKGIKTGRLWVHVGDHDHRYTVYDYTPDHSGDGPGRVFRGFRGDLQADACSVYDALFLGGKIVEVGCWMHARRKFSEARTSDPARSHVMLAWVAGLYEVEDDAKLARKAHPDWDDATWQAYRYELRLQRSRPLLERTHTWLEAERLKVLPKSPSARRSATR